MYAESVLHLSWVPSLVRIVTAGRSLLIVFVPVESTFDKLVVADGRAIVVTVIGTIGVEEVDIVVGIDDDVVAWIAL